MTKPLQLIKVLVALILLVVVSNAMAEEKVQSPSGPVQITSDRLEADDSSGVMTFSGNVIAQQDGVMIYSSLLDLYFEVVEGKREITRIIATKDVRVVQGERVGTGQKAVFYRALNKIILTGDPKVHQGDDFVSGDEITVFLDGKKSVVKSEKGSRVKAQFHPREKAK